MASKLETISKLSLETSKKLSGYESWTAFLRCAAWQYKYSFEDQLLIFAQRPDARACADFATWNDKLHRRINRGAKGIALLREGKHEYYLDHVFDVSDTNRHINGIEVRLWQYQDKYDDAIMETLENSFGTLERTNSLVDAVISAVHNAAYDSKADYVAELTYNKDNSLLSNLDALNLDIAFQQTAEASIAYLILERLGLSPETVFTNEDFRYISDFNTPETIAVLGSAVSSISEQALREISGTIREELKREQSKFFAQQKELAYNQGKDEKQTDIPKERTEEHEHHLSDRERSTNTQFNSAGAHPTHRPVRTDAESLSQTAQTEPVRSHDDTRDATGTSGGSRPDSDTASRADGQTDGESRGRGRKTEGRKSAKMDRTDEQPQTLRRRGSAQTARSQLNIFDLNDDGKIAETMAREAEWLNNRPAFSFATKPPQAAAEQSFADFLRNIHADDDGKAVALFQRGDFFECYGMDAEQAAAELQSTVINKTVEGTVYPMCGFPSHTLEHYVNILNDKGYDVLLVDENKEIRRVVSTEKALGKTPLAEPKQETAKVPESIHPTFEKPKPERVASTVVYPEIPLSERHNFMITNDELGYGGAKEKFKRNMAAIRLLHELEFDKRLATPEEQEVLSQYVGWGGLADAFDETKSNWADEFQELYATLSPEEYTQARASTLNAHYTSPTVIKAMYRALENMGFRQGNILEPSCGIGNFMGLLPESMSESKMYGVELDSITGRIAQQLYQKNSIAIQGYESTTLPDSFFDVAIGNVPFGNYKLPDRRYNKHNFLIHDYFFAKTLDKVRPGGIVAFITSKGTMDKQNSTVRKYIAQRADLIGAIRLPNTAFKDNAGTEVTSDILFLQKRDRMTDIEPDWVHLGQLENGIAINQYFINHPDMILGEMTTENTMYGYDTTCKPFEGASLAEQLDAAIQNIHAQIPEYELEDISDDEDFSIPADPTVRNFSFTVVDGEIYFRENSIMRRIDLNATAQNRVKGMIALRDCVRELIEYQTEGYPDSDIRAQQEKLNTLYDDFTKKYGLINSRGNEMAFSDDSSYFLLCSLEILDENGELERKADMFTKRTIGAKKEVTQVDTADEALAVSLGEKARIDMEYMAQLTGKTEQELFEALQGVIFLNPQHTHENDGQEKYLTADEYLSGNVREKLRLAENAAANDVTFESNVEALKQVQPKDLSASEITVRLGTTWIPPEYIEQFTFELLSPSYYAQNKIHVSYSNITGEWNIAGKSEDKGVKAVNTYGTHRINAYRIIEESLNLKDVRIFDYVENENGNKVAVLNHKETTIAQQKQDAIKTAFDDWIWKEPDRRETLTKLYNEKFNSNRPREYDGSHITFHGMNPEIALRQHQKNAVARIMYGGNSLLGHVVGAGKTWTMVAAAMESRRLGLCNKSLFVVPNHLTEQWAAEFLQLYPAANILVATKKDFEMKNRKKFCGRIATGDYDAVIIGHSQFEKIPMSAERQRLILEKQMDEIIMGIAEAKANNAERFTIKQMEKTKRGLEVKLAKLNDQSRKDDVVTFEELGVDRVFVDEAHYYKNLYLYTKMRNVGGIAQTEAQKSSDLFMKTQYLDELTGGKGVIFATGTPISNSMVEMYTMQRYLQYGTLAQNNLQHFDAWASTFGETVTAIELAPEGTGYRAKTRFAKFFNLPELIAMFKQVADIQTADMLNLPVPQAEYHNIAVEPTDFQKDMVAELSERAEEVRNKAVDPTIDNMLKITNDGRKLALDQRMISPLLPDDEQSKVSACANNVFDIWQKTADTRATQLVFCDLSTPKSDGTFSVYNSIREKLMDKGTPEQDIAFIHDADNEAKKKELFSKVRKGDVRILLGSTPKMGAGTNVQTLLYASHDLDCPWRPADLEQRAGRIIRQGNRNEQVHIYRYVTKDTFDSYMWQTVENKQKFISQIMTSKAPVRSAEDIDETALSYAEIKALATGNPHIKEKMELDTEVAKLKLIKSSFLSQKYELEDKVIKYYPKEIARLQSYITGLEQDIAVVAQHPKQEDKFGPMTIDGLGYFEKEQAGTALLERCKQMTSPEPTVIGEYRGFTMELSFDTFAKTFYLTLKCSMSYRVELGSDVFGNIQRLDNALGGLEKRLETEKTKLSNIQQQFEVAKVECKKEFPQEAELSEKLKRLAAVDALLSLDKRSNEGVDMITPDEEIPQRRQTYEMAR